MAKPTLEGSAKRKRNAEGREVSRQKSWMKTDEQVLDGLALTNEVKRSSSLQRVTIIVN